MSWPISFPRREERPQATCVQGDFDGTENNMNEHGGSAEGLSRRSAIKGIAGGTIGAGLSGGPGRALGESQTAPARTVNPRAANHPIWQLDRPKPALPNSYFWTWDHSTNWMWDDPGMLNFGCNNRYLKRSETFVEDYRRLTDLAAGLGVKGIGVRSPERRKWASFLASRLSVLTRFPDCLGTNEGAMTTTSILAFFMFRYSPYPHGPAS